MSTSRSSIATIPERPARPPPCWTRSAAADATQTGVHRRRAGGHRRLRRPPHDPQSAHAKVLSIYAVMIGAMQLSRALADRQLADEILEQGIRLTLVHAEGEASGYRSTIRDTRPGEPTDANATRRPA